MAPKPLETGVAGTVTFTLHGSDLAYVWTDGIEKNVATLRKHK
jgi:hypothetical protein